MNQEDKKLLIKVFEIIDKSQKEDLLEFYRDFNYGKIPLPMYHLIPDWWTLDNERRFQFTIKVLDKIRTVCTEKELSKNHNVFHGKMSYDEFEYWFDNCSLRSGKFDENFYPRRNTIENLHWWKDDVFNKLVEAFPEIIQDEENGHSTAI